MLPVRIFLIQRMNNGLKVCRIVEKIGLAGIYQQCFYVVLPDILGIGVLNIQEIVVFDLLLVTSVSFSDVLLQFMYWCVQIDQDIRL